MGTCLNLRKGAKQVKPERRQRPLGYNLTPGFSVHQRYRPPLDLAPGERLSRDGNLFEAVSVSDKCGKVEESIAVPVDEIVDLFLATGTAERSEKGLLLH